tara:strand:+ start:3453 stop:3953 length:501 start_codon:yes stop_codon:yes gene_type:complete
MHVEMVNTNTIKTRIKRGAQYLKKLEQTIQAESWDVLYQSYKANTCSVIEQFVLIHPHFHPANDQRQDLRGRPSFVREPNQSERKCQADLIWGYLCELECEGVPESDHHFPYSYGGPTIAQNKIFLCNEHNALKSKDIHLYPWEQPPPRWLDKQITMIAKKRSQQC